MADFQLLPEEILVKIMETLSVKDLAQLALVATVINRITCDGQIWRKLITRDCKVNCPDTAAPNEHSWKELYHLFKQGKVHNRACAECYSFPVEGPLYKCYHCKNYALCQGCFKRSKEMNTHEEGHLFVKLRYPQAARVPQLYFQFPRTKQRIHKSDCSACGESPIVGTRFKCRQCPGYSLCEPCHEKELAVKRRSPGIKRYRSDSTHDSTHDFLEILFHEKKHTSHDSPTWCDACTHPIRGLRFKCLNCFNYDLCGECEAAERHKDNQKHAFLMLDGVSLCCYNLQYIDWTEKSEYAESVMKIQKISE